MPVSKEELLARFNQVMGAEYQYPREICSLMVRDSGSQYIQAIYRYGPETDASKPYLKAHFLPRRLLPGLLLGEAMAQTAGLLLWAIRGVEVLFVLREIGSLKFLKPVNPETDVLLQATLVERKRIFFKFQIEAFHRDGEPLVEATQCTLVVVRSQNL